MAHRRWLAWAGILAATHVLSACGQLCLNPQPEPPGNDCDKDKAVRGGTGGSTGTGGSGGMTTSDASVGIEGGGPIISSDAGASADVSADTGYSGDAGSDTSDGADDATDEEIPDGGAPDPDAPATDSSTSAEGGDAAGH